MMSMIDLKQMIGVFLFGVSPVLYGGGAIHISHASPIGGEISEGRLSMVSSDGESLIFLTDLDLDGDGDFSDKLELKLEHAKTVWSAEGEEYVASSGGMFQAGDVSKYSVSLGEVYLSGGDDGAVNFQPAFSGFRLSEFSQKKESVLVKETDHNNIRFYQSVTLLKGAPEKEFSMEPGEGSSWGVRAFDLVISVFPKKKKEALVFKEGERFQIHGLSRQNGEVFSVHAAGNSDGTQFEFGEPRRTDVGFHVNGMARSGEGDVLYMMGHRMKKGKELYFKGSSMLGRDGSIDITRIGAGKAIADEMSVDRTGRYLVASHYRRGIIQSFPILEDKTLGKQIQQMNDQRTKGHFVKFSRDNKSVYIPYVKDETALYQFSFDDATGEFTAYDPQNIGAEGGPRHLFAHPNGKMIYSSNEQQMGVSGYSVGADGRLEHVLTVDPGVLAKGEVVDAKLNSSFLAATADGQFLFVGTRDHSERDRDRITSYRVSENGSVQKVAELPFSYKIPWGCAVSPNGDYLIVNSVAFEETGGVHRLCAFFINQKDGSLKEVASIPIVEQMFSILSVPNRVK